MQTLLLAIAFGTTGTLALIEGVRLLTALTTAPRTGQFALLALVGVLLHRLLDRYLPFVPVLEHEMTHLAAAACLLRRPVELRATGGGGHVVFGPGRGTPLIRLAPYCVPSVPVAALAVEWLLQPETIAWNSLIACAWGYQAARAAADLGPHQTDLRAGGVAASSVAVAGAAAWMYGACALYQLGGMPLIREWLSAVSLWFGP